MLKRPVIRMDNSPPPSLKWLFIMAWRDSRTYRKRLMLYMAAIVLGVAALVSIRSFGSELNDAVNNQARTLLGADLMIQSRQPFTKHAKQLIDSVGGEQSREVDFSSMALFPKTGHTRLVQVRALKGGYPYYGHFQTTPAIPDSVWQQKKTALVEQSLLYQFDARPGDSVRIGNITFSIAAGLNEVPGESNVISIVGPRIFIPLHYLDQTGLMQFGSRASYRAYLHFKGNRDVNAVIDSLKQDTASTNLRFETVSDRTADLGRSMDNLYHFLNLVGFVALLLGAIGVASSIHVYIRQKLETVAILRCLGASSWQAFTIYTIQALTAGLGGALIGILAGIGIQALLPGIMNAFLPVTLPFHIYWSAVFEAVSIALGFTILFALLPLISIRNVTPLAVLRQSVDPVKLTAWKDPLKLLCYGLILGAVFAFSVFQTARWRTGLGFTAGIIVVFLLLSLVGWIIIKLVKRFIPSRGSFTLRQGLANLFRPHNQTLVLMITIGMATFLIATLYLVQGTLVKQIRLVGGKDRPNMVLFDIQKNQVAGLEDTLRQYNLPILQNVPIVTARLTHIGNRSISKIIHDSTARRAHWAMRHEFRITYRDSLVGTETLVKGHLQTRQDSSSGLPLVSLEQGIARDLRVGIGDTLVFNVQGVQIKSLVGSIRAVNWRRIQPNFFVVFPDGVLNQAPHFNVITTRTANDRQSAALQRAAVSAYPNISIIDLKLILQTVNSVMDRISFAIQFMTLFSVLTGLIVLIGSLVTSRYQRLHESVLLRTMGASVRQVQRIMAVEYVMLGIFSTLTGLILSVIATWLLSHTMFDSGFVISWPSVILTILIVPGITLLVGLFLNRRIHRHAPLEILREEG